MQANGKRPKELFDRLPLISLHIEENQVRLTPAAHGAVRDALQRSRESSREALLAELNVDAAKQAQRLAELRRAYAAGIGVLKELTARAAAGEPVDFRRTLASHGVATLPPNRIDEAAWTLERGRIRVRAEHQRSFAPLFLLWRGVGQYVAKHPRYRRLFGAVSISGEYRLRSRQLLVEFLQAHCFEWELARHIKPRHPFRAARRLEWSGTDLAGIADLEALSQLLAQVEPDEKGVPVLLRQYLKLGGRLLGFNVDADFNNALDGLIVVDLPPEEDEELCLPALSAGLNFIRLATPTTDDKRLPAVLRNTSGFVYYVSIAGITGTRSAANIARASGDASARAALAI